MSFKIFNNTDGVYADHREFKTKKEAEREAKEFRARYYMLQGYYKTADGRRISPEDVDLVIEEV